MANEEKCLRTTRCGFTLIELLVVIAIIALLVSILVPSLSQAKGLAQRAICLTHMRNMGTGIHMYANDNVDVIPPILVDLSTPNAAYRWWWCDFIVKYFDTAARPLPWPSSSYYSVGNQPKNGVYDRGAFAFSRMLNCPSQPNRWGDPDQYMEAPHFSYQSSTAWMNVNGNAPNPFGVYKSSELSGDLIMVFEPAGNFYLLNENYNPSRTMYFYDNAVHLKAYNDSLKFDGSAEPVHKQVIKDWYLNTNRQGLPFCQPDKPPRY